MMRKFLSVMIAILSVGLISVSLYVLMGMYLEDKKSQNTFDDIKVIFDQDSETDPGKDSEDSEEVYINPGLLELHEMNPDCIGWIKIEDTNIDYPVMYHPDEKNFYLRKNFYKEYDICGTPFIAEICDPDDYDNMVIYGHHMKSGAMFAHLDKYKSEDFYKEHTEFTYSTLHGDETYEIIACFATPVYTGNDFAYYDFTKAETPLEFYEFVDKCRKLSYYDTGKTAVYGDKLICLSTCEYTHRNGRMVVVGKLKNEVD